VRKPAPLRSGGGIEGVAVGPGSSTGLCVAVVAARTLGWSEDLPVHPVCTLQAIATRAGDGRHLVLMPLKRDTTFHAAFALAGDRCETLAPVTATLDAQQPQWGPDLAEATVIGPAVRAKPELVARWAAGRAIGEAWVCDARAVAKAASRCEPCSWDRLRVAYRIASAPELQRRDGEVG